MKRHNRICAASLVISASLGIATPALAADYLLELRGVRGEASEKVSASAIYWGDPHENLDGRAAAPAERDGRFAIQSPRDPASGQATGRRCTMGKHFTEVVIKRDAQAWTLHDVTMTSCGMDRITFSYGHLQASADGTGQGANN